MPITLCSLHFYERTGRELRRMDDLTFIKASQLIPGNRQQMDPAALWNVALVIWRLCRSENFLKNKLNGCLQKLLRKILVSCCSKHKNPPIKFNTLTTIMNLPKDKPFCEEREFFQIKGKTSPIRRITTSDCSVVPQHWKRERLFR